jgi:hypothetical protein
MLHRLFDLTLASDFDFASRLVSGEAEGLVPDAGTPDLTFTCSDQPPLSMDWEQATLLYSAPHRTESDESTVRLYRLNGCDALRFAGVADFYLWSDRIVCHLLDPAHDYLVEIQLLGPVLSFWLERQGIPALHASAVVVGERAVAFLSSNQGGKSSLAAALMQEGYPLLTDDILPVDLRQGVFVGRPGYPQMRMWPDVAQHFVGHHQDLELVHPELPKRRVPVGPGDFGTFCDVSQTLSCTYLPERFDPEEAHKRIEIRPVSPRDAVIELVRHSFTPRVVEAIGLQAQRLDFFARMVQQVPMRRLVYPSGFEHLPRVSGAILEDLNSLRMSA